jgi:serine/threonine-protein kinase
MTPTTFVGTVLDGKFQIEKPLASGASGDVFEALHLALNTRVAVKVLRPGVPETADIRRKRFLREARVAARMRSDHVVRVFDVVAPERGPTYIVMELLQGETLAQLVRRAGRLPPGEAVDYVVQAAKALGEMHDAGIVHRDVKPSNLFLALDADGKNRIKLLDFGVAAFQQPVARHDSSITLSEAIIGTPRYMAPEQVQSSKRVDARADVWALGVTLYELLAACPPFDGQTVLAVLNQIENQEPRRLTDVRPDVPPSLAAVVHACLEKDPDRRPANARAVAEALLGLLSAETLSEEDARGLAQRRRIAFLVGSKRARLVLVGVAVALASVAATLIAATRPSREPQGPVTSPERIAVAPPATTTSVRPAAPTTAVVSTQAVPAAMSVSIAPHENTTAHRGPDLMHPPAPSNHPINKPPPPRPPPQARPAARRPSPEDDDRIE